MTGKRVMFTSPRQYACKLSYKLIEQGAKPIWVPGVQITSLCDPARQQACSQPISAHADAEACMSKVLCRRLSICQYAADLSFKRRRPVRAWLSF